MPAQGRLSSFNNGELNSFIPTGTDLTLCPALSSGPSPAPPAVFVDYVFDAVLSVAWAAAAARKCTAANTCSVPFNTLTPAMVYAQLLAGGIPVRRAVACRDAMPCHGVTHHIVCSHLRGCDRHAGLAADWSHCLLAHNGTPTCCGVR